MAAGKMRARPGSAGRVVELFAGVGGFRLGLEPHGWRTVWASQWEPSTKTQHAADCYRHHFDPDVLSNEDINAVVDQMDRDGWDDFPDHDLLVGGFPCQDYSVAKARSQAQGIIGKKGVLWWAIKRIIEKKNPRFVFLENVDRLLKSPASQRGRDFAIILACLSDLGYLVEWRVVNAADYGFPQRRRRVFVIAHRVGDEPEPDWSGPSPGWPGTALSLVVFLSNRRSRRTSTPQHSSWRETSLNSPEIRGREHSHSIPGGGDHVAKGCMDGSRRKQVLGPAADWGTSSRRPTIPESFFIQEEQRESWAYMKGPRTSHESRRTATSTCIPKVGSNSDPVDQPSRTILTGEGG